MVHPTLSLILLSLGLLLPALPARAAQDDKKASQDDKKTAQDDKKAAQDDKKAQEESAKKAIDEFNDKMKEAKGITEKALAIMTFGDVEPKDKSMVSPLARYLGAVAGDINFVLVTAAADALGKFRASPQAAVVLGGALANYKKNAYIASKISMAIGRVGHELSLPLFEEHFKGTDQELAVGAVWAIAEFPGPVALEALFREANRIDKERAKQNLKDEYKKVYDRVYPEIIKAIKKVSAQPWPTIKELTIWWNRHGAEFKEEAAKKEKEKKTESLAAHTTLPAVLLVEFLFKENGGTTPGNSGVTGVNFPTATMTAPKPSWTTTAAPNGGPAAIDFEKSGGAYAVDLGGGNGIDNLKNLKSFTITGWTIPSDIKEGPSDKMAGAGNRILSWFNPLKVNEGVELVYRADGSLQLGIGQWADASTARSTPGIIPYIETKAGVAGTDVWNKWRFFAVTYDSGLASNHVKFYCASQNEDAKLINSCDYNRGPSGAKISPQLTIGNVPPQTRPMAPERSFRGILDEIRIYGSTLDGSGALPIQEIIKIENRPKQGA